LDCVEAQNKDLNTLWLLIPVALVVAIIVPFWLRWLPPPHAVALVRITQDGIQLRKGQLRPYAREQVVEIVREKGISNGFIAMLPGRKVVFSRSVPANLHQRLRNVLLNQAS
jgi:hypothetical protein